MMKIQHIVELFSLDGQEFVREAYRNLLHREPDEHGAAYYLGRLALGHSKAEVILQLAQSPEFKTEPKIKGLDRLIAETKRQNHWLWGRIGRHKRFARLLRSQHAAVSNLTEPLGSMAAQIHRLSEQFAHLHSFAREAVEKLSGPPPLPAEDVRKAYIEILGREPENDAVIREHAQLGSVEKLRHVLLSSEEFQMRLNALPEYARTILKRHLQLLNSGIEG